MFGIVRLKLKSFTNIRQWTLDWLTSATSIEATIFAVTIWHIWAARNSVRNGEPAQHPRQVAEKIKIYVEMILQHSSIKPPTRCDSIRSSPNWNPPPVGLAMLNVDAAIFSEINSMGAGFVLRNDLGVVLLAKSIFIDHTSDPELAEALATRCALQSTCDAVI